MLRPVDSHDAQEPPDLVAALVDAFPSYLWGRMAKLGVVAGTPIVTAVAEGTAELSAGLRGILNTPVAEQSKSPLEIVRNATRGVTAVLEDLGVRPAERDDWESSAQPEDLFGLFPASSEDLGEEAWQLHLRWGLEKAKVVAGVVPAASEAARLPAVAVFGIPVEDRDRVTDEIVVRGYRVLLWRNPAALEQATVERPVLVLVDLRHRNAHDAIRTLGGEGMRVVATSGYVDDLMRPGLLALGASEVMVLDDVVARLDSLLPRIT